MDTSSSNYTNELRYKNLTVLPIAQKREDFSSQSGYAYSQSYSVEKCIQADPIQNIEISVFDVAAYILSKLGSMTTMKLHKLLYYAQAWSLVWEENPLFKQSIEAWANGPVIRELFNFHRGLYTISVNDLNIGNPEKLSSNQREDIDDVLNFYGNKSAQWLIDQTHYERPWRNARVGLAANERGNTIIQLTDMMEYYSSLK